MKFLHLTPGLLLSADGRISREGRFYAFLTGDIEGILSWHRPTARKIQGYGMRGRCHEVASRTPPEGGSVKINREEFNVLLPGGCSSESLSSDQHSVLEVTGLSLTREGVRVVCVPVGTRSY